MAKETRIIFDPTDIRNIRIVCSTCKGGAVLPLAKTMDFKLPHNCPHCRAGWFDGLGSYDSIIGATYQLLKAVHYLHSEPVDEKVPLTVRFEIDGE